MGRLRADDARHQPGHRLDQNQGGQLPARHHVVADRHLLGGQPFDHTLVEPLVAAAQEREVWLGGQLADEGLAQPASGRRHRHDPAAVRIERLDGREQRLGFHHHAGAAAEGRIVHRPMWVTRERPKVVDHDGDDRPPRSPFPAGSPPAGRGRGRGRSSRRRSACAEATASLRRGFTSAVDRESHERRDPAGGAADPTVPTLRVLLRERSGGPVGLARAQHVLGPVLGNVSVQHLVRLPFDACSVGSRVPLDRCRPTRTGCVVLHGRGVMASTWGLCRASRRRGLRPSACWTKMPSGP